MKFGLIDWMKCEQELLKSKLIKDLSFQTLELLPEKRSLNARIFGKCFKMARRTSPALQGTDR